MQVTARQNVSDGRLFNLDSLNQFTQNDPNALRMIITNFIDSTKENCEVLEAAAANMDVQGMADIAHKMIPMLKQMEVYSIADLLLPIEEKSLGFDREQMRTYVNDICERIGTLSVKLRLEVQ